MNETVCSFGSRANQAQSAAILLQLEQAEGRDARFIELDALVGDLLVRSLRGERILTMRPNILGGWSVSLRESSPVQRAFVDAAFGVEQQRSRGELFLPEKVKLWGGLANMTAAFRESPRLPMNLVLEEAGQVPLESSAEAVLLWSVLEPMFTALHRPLLLRGPETAMDDWDKQIEAWRSVSTFYQELGLDLSRQLAVMGYGGGWHRLRADRQLAAKRELLIAMSQQAAPKLAARYRAIEMLGLVRHYYSHGKGGPVTRRKVSTETAERTLAAFFGGDWLAFLDYLGEQPHPDDQVMQGLPETRLYVRGAGRVAEVAAQSGIPAEEIQRILGTFWQQPEAKSPVEERVAVLQKYWVEFDRIHVNQKAGMKPLWGLVEQSPSLSLRNQDTVPYQPGLYLEILSRDLLSEIERLWGTTMLPRWPERIVTTICPHAMLAETLGRALDFWHGCSLTAWFLCEGPSSVTDMEGLAHYHRRDLAELEHLGVAIPARLFEELIKAQGQLGASIPVDERVVSVSQVGPIELTTRIATRFRREGFEKLRDIITRYRQAWTQEYLDQYLRARWEPELRSAAQEYSLLLHKRGKPPTLKQFASAAAPATNHWFGGDISGLYRAMGEKISAEPERGTGMVPDKMRFARAVASALDGRLTGNLHLGEHSLWYLQLGEALGRAPSMRDFGSGKLEWIGAADGRPVDDVWRIFSGAVEAVKWDWGVE